MSDKQKVTPRSVWQEYESGRRFKSGLGELGLYEQNRRNERFFVGDQWHGARCGGERPLVRHNVIKRIGDYKTSIIDSNPLSVSFSAEGVPNTVDLMSSRTERLRRSVCGTVDNGYPSPPQTQDPRVSGEEIETVMTALSEYFNATANRLNLEDIKERVLRDAYISGTAVVYTYWDPDVQTGLYADVERKEEKQAE